jgi:hypothetical protein
MRSADQGKPRGEGAAFLQDIFPHLEGRQDFTEGGLALIVERAAGLAGSFATILATTRLRRIEQSAW